MKVMLLDDVARRVALVLPGLLRHDEGVEATTTSEASMTEPAKIKTCPACGRTGAIGPVFYESNPTRCKPCTTKKINEHIHEVNELTRSTAENHRQPWSELEVEMLLGAVAEGMHCKDVAEMLGRTYLSVHGKLGTIRKLLEEGRAVSYVTYEIHTETKTTITRRTPCVCPACHLIKPCFCEEDK